jgi:hypothetical protein
LALLLTESHILWPRQLLQLRQLLMSVNVLVQLALERRRQAVGEDASVDADR